MNRCDYCLEKNCKKKKCDCSKCDKVDKCYKFPRPTVRITNKCTQKCSHCCFESSPESNIMMSVDNARKISMFLRNNDIPAVQVMGGEFFCNPDWYEILCLLMSSVRYMRLVTNGDWVVIDNVREQLSEFIENNKEDLTISLSYDTFHTNKHFDKAKEFLENCGCNVTFGKGDEEKKGIVPVGRSQFAGGFFSMLGSYCFNPEKQYTFLIDEEGAIYKCAFGRWQYASVDEYMNGGFCERFREFNMKFYNIFIPNCRRCNETACLEANRKDLERNPVIPI